MAHKTELTLPTIPRNELIVVCVVFGKRLAKLTWTPRRDVWATTKKCQRNMSQLTRVHDLAYALASHRAKDVDQKQKNKWEKNGNGESDKEPLVTYSLHFATRRIACAWRAVVAPTTGGDTGLLRNAREYPFERNEKRKQVTRSMHNKNSVVSCAGGAGCAAHSLTAETRVVTNAICPMYNQEVFLVAIQSSGLRFFLNAVSS